MRLEIPELSMVALIGTTGSGKSTFARKLFLPTEVLSSDEFRGMVSDDVDSQEATKPAFAALHFVLATRLELGRLSVVDATNVQPESRAPLLKIASDWHCLKVAIVLDVPERVCHDRNASRPNRQFGPHVIRRQRSDLRRSLGSLRKEGWHKIYILSPEQIDAVEVVRTPIYSRRMEELGPFDIIGDVHGCFEELEALLDKLGWVKDPLWRHPDSRRAIFLGDLVDRGPKSVSVLRLVMDLCERRKAFCVPGNHDDKLARALAGKKVTLSHGLEHTLFQLQKEPTDFQAEVKEFLEGLVSHLVVDRGALCVAHAGMRQEMQGRGSGAVRAFALYGETTGEIDEFGLPVRQDWARTYKGKATVVYGHTPIPEPEWVNGTINIDTGCCFGGRLSALRYPEKEIVQVPALHIYAEPARPLVTPSDPNLGDSALDIEDVSGRRNIETSLFGRVSIPSENATAALEVMSRFAVDPRWLIYLPPTMSPCETSDQEGWLERPEEAFQFYRQEGLNDLICQEKHMGSRACAVICRSEDTAATRFRIRGQGMIWTRTGRRFFEDSAVEAEVLRRMAQASLPLFERLKSPWLLLDMEIMPWSQKAVGLLKDQYGPVGASACAVAQASLEAALAFKSRGLEGAEDLVIQAEQKLHAATAFREAYRRYCWPVSGVDGLSIAPFHLLASEGEVHSSKDHLWHMAAAKEISIADPMLFRATDWKRVNLEDALSVKQAIDWWQELTTKGGEGMVVKPVEFAPTKAGRALQPAVKCRGREYLRIIYGPEYLAPENLPRLKIRSLRTKRILAAREFALGMESLRRFVSQEPLRRVHECVFGVLALESSPVDPRL
jgi:protein phosphatase